MLLFLSEHAEGEGGETHFTRLGIKVEPRIGDGIVWNNIMEETDEENNGEERVLNLNGDFQGMEPDGNEGSHQKHHLLEAALHQGLPPVDAHNDNIKYACNVWIREDDIQDLSQEAYRT